MTSTDIQKYLSFPCIRPICYENVTSTNTLMRKFSSGGEAEGLLITADFQSDGRGRQGKSFYSPNSGSIYMSLLLRPCDNDVLIPFITPMAAVSTAAAIEKICGISVHIKWVNDLMLNSKKVCGILTEAVRNPTDSSLESVILGIGVNLFSPKYGFGELESVAGSIFLQDKYSSDLRARLTAEIADSFFDIYYNLDINVLLTEYKNRLFILGEKIDVIKNGKAIRAVALDINHDFNLLVKYENGEEELLKSGEISIIPQ